MESPSGQNIPCSAVTWRTASKRLAVTVLANNTRKLYCSPKQNREKPFTHKLEDTETETVNIRKICVVRDGCMQIAGAAAAEGLSLKEVAAVANETAMQCYSVGVATDICTLPGAAPSNRSPVQLPLLCSDVLAVEFCFGSLGTCAAQCTQ